MGWTGGRAREPPRREPRGTPCTCISPRRARRCSSPRTPCTGFAASRARRLPSPRTPCTCFAPSRARRCLSPRTPCTCVAASRARRSLSPGTPCSNTLPASCRARTSRRFFAPRPRADASRGPRPWRSARSVVTHDSDATLPATAETFLKLHVHVLRSQVEKNGSTGVRVRGLFTSPLPRAPSGSRCPPPRAPRTRSW